MILLCSGVKKSEKHMTRRSQTLFKGHADIHILEFAFIQLCLRLESVDQQTMCLVWITNQQTLTPPMPIPVTPCKQTFIKAFLLLTQDLCTYLCGGRQHYDPGQQHYGRNQVVEHIKALCTTDFY